MDHLTQTPEAKSLHSSQWDTGTPTAPGTHVIDAVISNEVQHAELVIGDSKKLHLAKPQAFTDLLLDRMEHDHGQLNSEILNKNNQLMHVIGRSAIVLFSPEKLVDDEQLIAVPLQTDSSLVLETDPQSPFAALRHEQVGQIAQINVEPSSDVRLEVFDIDTDMQINVIRSLGRESVRTYNSGWTNYLHVKSVDTSEGIVNIRR